MFQATIIITLRASILDVQGKAVEHGIHALGIANVANVRIGKHVQMDVDAPNESEARRLTEDVCRKILANSVMEDYSYTMAKA